MRSAMDSIQPTPSSPPRLGPAPRLSDHPGLRIKSHGFGEEVGEFDREYARPTSDVEESSGAVEA